MELFWTLGIPLAGGLVLGITGHRRWAPELNALFSTATLVSACLLVAKLFSDGPMTAFSEQLFVDSFNVVLIGLTALVGCTTALFSRPYMRVEEHHGKISALRLRLFHSMYQFFMFTMLLVLSANNLGIAWVG